LRKKRRQDLIVEEVREKVTISSSFEVYESSKRRE
jgi:hypothetical protein